MFVEIRLACRRLRRAPAFVAGVVATLAIGIAGVTVVSGLADTLWFRALPYPTPGNLVTLDPPTLGRELFARMQQSVAFSSIGAYTERAANLAFPSAVERALVALMSERCLPTFDVQPVVGRMFSPEEYRGRGAPTVLLSYASWQRHYGGAADVVQRSMLIDDRPYAIVGVLPATFRTLGELRSGDSALLDRRVAVFLPVSDEALFSIDRTGTDQAGRSRILVGRLRPHASLERVRAEVAATTRGRSRQSNGYASEANLTPLADVVLRGLPAQMTVLLLAVGVLCLVACGNAMTLMLARAEHRRHELNLQAILGAPLWRLVVNVLTETTLLTALGGAAGLLIAWEGIRLIRWAAGDMVTRVDELQLSPRLMVLGVVIAISAGLLTAAVPILRIVNRERGACARWSKAKFKDASYSVPTSRLVSLQVALSVVIVVVGTMLARDFVNASAVKRGFDPADVLSVEIALSRVRYPGDRAQAFFDELLRRSTEVPGVINAALVNAPPGGSVVWMMNLQAEGGQPEAVPIRYISASYFSLLSIPVIAGRSLAEADPSGSAGVVLVNEAFARGHWGTAERAIGRWILPTATPSHSDDPGRGAHTIVGVVASTREYGVLVPEMPEVYWSFRDRTLRRTHGAPSQMTLLLRSNRVRAESLVAPLRAVVQGLDPRQPLYNVRTLERLLFSYLARQRLAVGMMVVFGVTTLVLAAVGIYGLMSYAAAMRRREAAVRLALGCSPLRVVAALLRSSAPRVLYGSALGVPIAIGWTWLASSQFLSVSGTDSLTCAGAVTFVAAVSMVAALPPAWQSAHTDPATVLREGMTVGAGLQR